MSKRGVSPLIATIFLIAVAVALGSIVMSLGQDYVAQAGPAFLQGCTAASFQVKHVEQQESLLLVTLDNGEIPLEGFVTKVFSQDYHQGSSERVYQHVDAYDVAVLSVPLEEMFSVYELTLLPIMGNEVCDARGVLITRGSSLFR